MSITVNQGSILDSEADFIVNPANQFLRHGAGLARVIADAAAPKNLPGPSGDAREPNRCDEVGRIWWDEQYRHALIPTGGAALTSAGHLPYRGVIHAVGPVWGGGSFCEKSLLTSAHREALAIAQAEGGASIAFPAISCGIFGFPVELAAPVAIAACSDTRLQVEFWLFEDAHFGAYNTALLVEQGGAWGEGPTDDGIPRVDQGAAALAAAARLEAAAGA